MKTPKPDDARTPEELTDRPQVAHAARVKRAVTERRMRPGQVGLANEVRPGLGTRADAPDQSLNEETHLAEDDNDSPPLADPRKYQAPPPEPREQAPDTFAHEMERSTGASGQSSGS